MRRPIDRRTPARLEPIRDGAMQHHAVGIRAKWEDGEGLVESARDFFPDGFSEGEDFCEDVM